MRKFLAFSAIATAVGCGPAERTENSAICGITMLAASSMIIDELTQTHNALTQAPAGLEGRVATRAIGYGTTPAEIQTDEQGSIVVQYPGLGFPETPGFGAALVDDSSEVFRGILIWDKNPPPDDYPRIGTIADASVVLPLIGVRVNWAAVNSERCPLFADLDSTATQ